MGICVAHLVYKPSGTGALRVFMDSYRSHPAGAEHELVLILRGFAPGEGPDPELVGDTRVVRHPDAGFDIDSYWQLLRETPQEHLCFLNSYSRILSDDWLGKLSRALVGDAGVVGASGSYASHSSLLRWELGLGGPYRRICGRKRDVNAETFAIAREQGNAISLRHPLIHQLAALKRVPSIAMRFRPYPAHHIRTNAFAISREVMQAIKIGAMHDKTATWQVESGTTSLTTQVEGMGLKALVVGADGLAYERDRWPVSRTFWQNDQENLLVADNQTDLYANGTPARRLLLSRIAWADQASIA
jgi:hypothetical protein